MSTLKDEDVLLSSAEPDIESGIQQVTEFDIASINVDHQAKDYFLKHGINGVIDAFTVANILHTSGNVRQAATLYGLAYRLHSGRHDEHPSRWVLLHVRLLCLLKSGTRPPAREIDILRALNIPMARYIEGIDLAWSQGRGREALSHMQNAYEEFHTGEEVDCRYLEIAIQSARDLFGASTGQTLDKIPARIFMYWDKNPPEEIRQNFEYHQKISDFVFKAFSKEEAEEWLYSNYGVEARTLFMNMRHPAEAADFLRVHVTQIYGGWWMDADIRLRDQQAVHFLQNQTASNVFVTTNNYFVHNDFYGAVANSSVLNDCLLSLYRNSYLYHGLYIAYKTGPGIFNRALNRRLWRTIQGRTPPDSVQIYTSEVFDQVIELFDTPYKATLPTWHAVG